MIQRATKTTAQLVVEEAAAAGQPPEVENLLESEIRYLLLRDSRGDYFAGRSLAKACAGEADHRSIRRQPRRSCASWPTRSSPICPAVTTRTFTTTTPCRS